MRYSLFALSVAAFPLTGTMGAEIRLGGHMFQVPDGFEVVDVAGPPLVDRPIVADFDEEGRLYVADSSGSNDKVDKQLAEKPHRIVRLEDTDADGRFDKSIVFADQMMFPEGAMWLEGSLYVAAPPSIWKLTDTDGDGKADEREEWFQGKTLTGCANDLHGPYRGPDGWIYWCKGAFAQQTHERAGQSPLVTKAAHIFRCRPDGSGLESVMTGGMDNPVEVAFTAGGERIFTTTFFQHPAEGKRDGLVHAIYGGVYGKVHDVLDNHKRTGDIMPVLTHFGAGAPSGLTRHASSVWGADYQDNLFAALFNLHKVTRHVLERDGATFRTRDSDLLVSDNSDFHPTDVIEDADGSLLVVDTGGWYKLCCPTSQLHKPDVLGAIYRVRRTGAPLVKDPRGRQLDWAGMQPSEVVELLGDSRPAVRERATQRLGKLGAQALPLLMGCLGQSPSAEARRNAVWALTRIEDVAARPPVRRALSDRDESVALAAVHSASVWRDSGALPHLMHLTRASSLHLRRAAAEALGRLGDAAGVPALLEMARASDAVSTHGRLDRVLEHSLIYALIEIANPAETRLGIEDVNPLVRRVALIALDQMDGGGLGAAAVAPLMASANPILKETASWIAARHADWGDALGEFFRKRLASKSLGEADCLELEHQLASFARAPATQELLAATLRDAELSDESRGIVLGAMARSTLKEPPSSWVVELTRLVRGADPKSVARAISTVRALPAAKDPSPELMRALVEVAHRTGTPKEVRLDALASVHGGLAQVDEPIFEFLQSSVAPSNSVMARTTAAGVLAKAKLSTEQLSELTETLKTAGPLEMPKLLAAFENQTDEALGTKLLAALKESSAATALRAETLLPRLAKFPESVQRQGEALINTVRQDTATQRAHLDELLGAMKGGDVRRGQAIFNSPKTACVSCHAIGYLGGKLGPDLTKIGQVRTERDLLESIIYPSASFVRSYEPVIVVTKSADDHAGILREDGRDEVLLGTGPGVDVRVARADIVEMRPGALSVMPEGMDTQLSREELADLVAFLKATKW